MAGELRYGDKVHIQNGYDNWQGGYLDANTGSSAGPTSVYQVATAATSNRSAVLRHVADQFRVREAARRCGPERGHHPPAQPLRRR